MMQGSAGSRQNGDHFPSLSDRARTSTRHVARSGRLSPTHSAHASLVRSSLSNIQPEWRARKVRFFRNGDRFFEGMLYAVSPERFRTFESLLAELTSSPLGDRNVLPNGVRAIFTLDGTRRIRSLDALVEGDSYVCASTAAYRPADYAYYGVGGAPAWNANNRVTSPTTAVAAAAAAAVTSFGYVDESRDYITPRLITVIRNGSKPRRAVRVLLNRKTVHSFEQVLTDITDAIKLDSGSVKKIYTLDGKPVQILQHFFQEDTVFVAYGPEKQSLDDFDLDNNEIRFVSAYKTVRQCDRIALKSPKIQRKFGRRPPSAKTFQDYGLEIPPHRPTSNGTPPSPRTARKPLASKNHPGVGKMNNDNYGTYDAPPPSNLTLKYKIGQKIGEGNFAVVKECFDREKRVPYALKIIARAQCAGREGRIASEVAILRRLEHHNVVRLIDEFDTPRHLYLVMELVQGGDLFDALATASSYTEKDASGMLYNLACAISYLHSLHIVHRDIKPENILIYEHTDGSKSLKLGDFGLATEAHSPLLTVCGTPTYVAPEVLAETGYGLKVDIWAAGVITYILLCGFPPFASATHKDEELFEKISLGKYEYISPFWNGISDSVKELIGFMLQVDPADRYTADELLKHPWVVDDLAKEDDLHVSVASQIGDNFQRKSREEPAMALITCTALDHSSRYFRVTSPTAAPLQAQENGGGEDETF